MQSFSEAYHAYYESFDPQKRLNDPKDRLAQAAAYKAYQRLKQSGGHMDRDVLCGEAEQTATDWMTSHPEWSRRRNSLGAAPAPSEVQRARVLNVRHASREQAESLWQMQDQSSQSSQGDVHGTQSNTAAMASTATTTGTSAQHDTQQSSQHTGATSEHITEQADEGVGGITGQQHYGKIDLKHL